MQEHNQLIQSVIDKWISDHAAGNLNMKHKIKILWKLNNWIVYRATSTHNDFIAVGEVNTDLRAIQAQKLYDLKKRTHYTIYHIVARKEIPKLTEFVYYCITSGLTT